MHRLIADASEAAGVERVYQAVEANLAGLDILVACAALGAHPIHEMSDHDWRYVIEPGSTGSDMRECDPPEQRDLIGQHRMLRAEQVAEAILFVLTRRYLRHRVAEDRAKASEGRIGAGPPPWLDAPFLRAVGAPRQICIGKHRFLNYLHFGGKRRKHIRFGEG